MELTHRVDLCSSTAEDMKMPVRTQTETATKSALKNRLSAETLGSTKVAAMIY
jgi:hypothetical protein